VVGMEGYGGGCGSWVGWGGVGWGGAGESYRQTLNHNINIYSRPIIDAGCCLQT
jgi:hypothetical protein